MEMIASSMMIVTIHEEQSSNVGYKPRPATTGRLGSTLSRKSVKTNLSLLATSDCSMDVSDDENNNSNNYYSSSSSSYSIQEETQDADEWGFFMDSP